MDELLTAVNLRRFGLWTVIAGAGTAKVGSINIQRVPLKAATQKKYNK